MTSWPHSFRNATVDLKHTTGRPALTWINRVRPAGSIAGPVPASGVCNDDDVNMPGATRLLSAVRKIERRSIAPRAPIRIGNVSAAARSMDAFCQVGILEIRQQRQCFKIEDRYQFAVDRDQLVLA